MASGKSKQKPSTRRTATAHEKAVLKAAKERGLIKIDLRKGLTKYARSKVKQFEAVYRQEAAVVSVPRKDAAKFALPYAHGKMVVPKSSLNEQVRYDKNKGQLVGYSKGKKKRVIRSNQTRVVVRIYQGTELKTRKFYGQNAYKDARAYVFYGNYEDADGIWEGVTDEYFDELESDWKVF